MLVVHCMAAGVPFVRIARALVGLGRSSLLPIVVCNVLRFALFRLAVPFLGRLRFGEFSLLVLVVLRVFFYFQTELVWGAGNM